MSESLIPIDAQPHPEQAPDAYDWRNDPQLSEKWKKRFAFYDSLPPAPSQWAPPPGMQAAMKKLSFKERILVSANILGFFFHFIYLGIFLKLWKQAAMVLGAIFVLAGIGAMLNLSDNVLRALGMVVTYWVCWRVNYWYFLSKAKGKDIGWML